MLFQVAPTAPNETDPIAGVCGGPLLRAACTVEGLHTKHTLSSVGVPSGMCRRRFVIAAAAVSHKNQRFRKAIGICDNGMGLWNDSTLAPAGCGIHQGRVVRGCT